MRLGFEPQLRRARVSGPPERLAPAIVGLFLAIQLALLGQATLPVLFSMPWQLHWPWSMFSKLSVSERHLEATAVAQDGARSPIPLAEIFTYTRGFTRLHVYDHSNIFERPDKQQRRIEFARFLAQAQATRAAWPEQVELAFSYVNLDDARVERRVIGSFPTRAGQ